jgi:hypothetical protein
MDCWSRAESDGSLSSGVIAVSESKAIRELTIASGVLLSAVTTGRLPLLDVGALVLDPPPNSNTAATMAITTITIHKTLFIGLINFYRPFALLGTNSILAFFISPRTLTAEGFLAGIMIK